MDHRIIFGNVEDVLRSLPAESVDCVFTSPPYFGLRSYGDHHQYVAWVPSCAQAWVPCEHEDRATHWQQTPIGYIPKAAFPEPRSRRKRELLRHRWVLLQMRAEKRHGLECPDTGVRIDALGLEPTPDLYVEHLRAIFEQVRRVLKPGGTVALNLGDSYAAQRGGTYQPAETLAGGQHGVAADGSRVNRGRGDGYCPSRNASAYGLKHKDLIGIPWRVAFALQADGWYLRSDIIWAKGISGEATRNNGWCGSVIPESVRDRPTQSHEHIFLLSKAPRYWYDHYAVQEDGKYPAGTKAAKGSKERSAEDGVNARPAEYATYSGKRNLRNVVTVSTRGFKGAHFAVFPPGLPLMFLPAMCPPKVCAECGMPWEHRVERGQKPSGRSEGSVYTGQAYGERAQSVVWGKKRNLGGDGLLATDLGYFPACSCDADAIPGTVLDPFLGSGTTTQVARQLGLRSIGIELNPAYKEVMVQRLKGNVDDIEFTTDG